MHVQAVKSLIQRKEIAMITQQLRGAVASASFEAARRTLDDVLIVATRHFDEVPRLTPGALALLAVLAG